MPFQMDRGPAVIIEKEILKGAGGLDDILSYVVDSVYVEENPASSGRYILEAGTVLSAGPSDGRVKPVYDGDSVSEGDVVGILGHTREFWLGPGITAGDATDEPVPVLHMGCHFNVDKLVGYTGNETEVEAALNLCKFS
jgi:hypothetical protein